MRLAGCWRRRRRRISTVTSCRSVERRSSAISWIERRWRSRAISTRRISGRACCRAERFALALYDGERSSSAERRARREALVHRQCPYEAEAVRTDAFEQRRATDHLLQGVPAGDEFWRKGVCVEAWRRRGNASPGGSKRRLGCGKPIPRRCGPCHACGIGALAARGATTVAALRAWRGMRTSATRAARKVAVATAAMRPVRRSAFCARAATHFRPPSVKRGPCPAISGQSPLGGVTRVITLVRWKWKMRTRREQSAPAS